MRTASRGSAPNSDRCRACGRQSARYRFVDRESWRIERSRAAVAGRLTLARAIRVEAVQHGLIRGIRACGSGALALGARERGVAQTILTHATRQREAGRIVRAVVP